MLLPGLAENDVHQASSIFNIETSMAVNQPERSRNAPLAGRLRPCLQRIRETHRQGARQGGGPKGSGAWGDGKRRLLRMRNIYVHVTELKSVQEGGFVTQLPRFINFL